MAINSQNASMHITIHGRRKEIGTDDYSLEFAAGEDAAMLAAGQGVSEEKANTVFQNRREHRLSQLKSQRSSRRGVVHWRIISI